MPGPTTQPADEEKQVARRFDVHVRALRAEAQEPVSAERARWLADRAFAAAEQLLLVLPSLERGAVGGQAAAQVLAVLQHLSAEEAEARVERRAHILHAHGYAQEALHKALSARRWAHTEQVQGRRFAIWDVQDTLIRCAFSVRELAHVVSILPLCQLVLTTFEEQPR